MSFKHKKKIYEILEMDFDTYAKFLKKEVLRAALLGELDAVICANHQFADGKSSALILMGAFVGDLASFFKKNKANPDFAKGKCFFETGEDGTKMHIAINSGKGKPDKINKIGKKLWAKAAIQPFFHAKKLPFLDAALDQVNVGETELVKVVDTENDTQAIKLVRNNYLKTRKVLQDRVLPLISNKKTLDTAYTNQHFKIAKVCLKNAASFLNKFEEVDEQTKVTYQKEITVVHAEYPKLRRINLISADTPNSQEKDIKESLSALDKEFEKLRLLKKEAKYALKYLDSL